MRRLGGTVKYLNNGDFIITLLGRIRSSLRKISRRLLIRHKRCATILRALILGEKILLESILCHGRNANLIHYAPRRMVTKRAMVVHHIRRGVRTTLTSALLVIKRRYLECARLKYRLLLTSATLFARWHRSAKRHYVRPGRLLSGVTPLHFITAGNDGSGFALFAKRYRKMFCG